MRGRVEPRAERCTRRCGRGVGPAWRRRRGVSDGVCGAAPQPRAAATRNHMRWCAHTCPNNKTWVAKAKDRVGWCVSADLCGARGCVAGVFGVFS
jgi:hypothetical protein